ncbi:MAG: transporter, permease family protein [Deltaproteobacteria bacterium]|nr:transporter, permease family protein [Deltaproteobacteria bacterium]
MTNSAPLQDRTFIRLTLSRLGRAIANFGTGEVKGHARLRASLLLLLLLAINGLNVLNSYVGRDFMTAIEHRNWQGFVYQTVLYIGVFALLTLAAVFYRFTEERLGLLWREWMTHRIVGGYLADHLYYHVNASGTVTNPDQRIADDVRTFTTMTLSLSLIFLNGTLTLIAFSGVLWSISRLLFVVAVLYAIIGSALAVLLGRPLVRLNYDQADKEANFRSDLIHIRENTESIALAHCEAQLRGRLRRRVDAFSSNLRRIIAVNRNLGFFTTGYNYLTQLIPVVIVAPLFIRGSAEFGEISQSAMAFGHVLGAFSLVVTQFPLLSSYAAVVTRLSPIGGWGEVTGEEVTGGITIFEDERRIAFENVTVQTPHSTRALIRALTLDLPARSRLLVTAASDLATDALQKAIAGIWDAGEGRIVRPRLDDIALLPDRPYTPPGTLREFLGRSDGAVVEDAIAWPALRTVGAAAAVERAGGLDVERDWDDVLSVEEQRLVALARLLIVSPRFAVIAHLGEGLDKDGAARLLGALVERGTGCVVLGDDLLRREDFDAVIEIDAEGGWKRTSLLDGA